MPLLVMRLPCRVPRLPRNPGANLLNSGRIGGIDTQMMPSEHSTIVQLSGDTR